MTDTILAPIAALTIPDIVAITSRAQSALTFIETFAITTAEDYGLAAEELQAIKAKAKQLEAQRTAITGPINKGLDAVNALFKGPAALLANGEALLKRSMLAFDQEQERIANEARRQAEALAAAERKRLDEEAAARQREAQAQAEAAAAATAAGDAQAAAQATAAAQRAQAEAQTAAMTSQMVVAPVVTPAKAKTTGISTSKKLDYEVTDLLALVKHIAERPDLINLIVADGVKLRAYVKGVGMACALPGVRVFEDRVMSARAA